MKTTPAEEIFAALQAHVVVRVGLAAPRPHYRFRVPWSAHVVKCWCSLLVTVLVGLAAHGLTCALSGLTFCLITDQFVVYLINLIH